MCFTTMRYGICNAIGIALAICISRIAMLIHFGSVLQLECTMFIKYGACDSIGTESYGIRASCNGTVAQSGGILCQRTRPATKSRGTCRKRFRAGAKSYGIIEIGYSIFAKCQRTSPKCLGSITKSHGILASIGILVIFTFYLITRLSAVAKGNGSFRKGLGSFPKGYRSDATGSIPLLVFIITAAKGQ